MSPTHLAHCGWAPQRLKTSAGRVAPVSTAARTSRSRIPLQLQTYTTDSVWDQMIVC
jgi:hypothetical protein